MRRSDPLVSVIIPTRNRPDLVGRAVKSALTQTVEQIEVIVVVDGPDEATLQSLSSIGDSRVWPKTLPHRCGPGGARNAGIAEAQGQWVAFLDDDDEWLPPKLEIQLESARQSTAETPLIVSRLLARTEARDEVWPHRLPDPAEPLCEYLLCQRTEGEGLVHIITMLTTRELLQKVPFRTLPRHSDLDWLLRVHATQGVAVQFVPNSEPLAIWHMDQGRSRIGTNPDWRFSLSWIQASRHLVTPRAYGCFVLTWVSAKAALVHDWQAPVLLLKESFRHGRPAATDVLSFAGIWLLPARVRRGLTNPFRAGGLRGDGQRGLTEAAMDGGGHRT